MHRTGIGNHIAIMAVGGSTDAGKEYLQKLLDKANDHSQSGTSEDVYYLYRNKPNSYFQDINNNYNGIMKKRLKDSGGDPRCPINSRLGGLFFGVTLHGGVIPDKSPFGNTRVKVPLSEVFHGTSNLYFADFFCKPSRNRIHYVTLVLTKADSEADMFCRENLIKLNVMNNLYLRKQSLGYSTLKRSKVFVDVFYTEDIDISNRILSSTGIYGRGQSVGGIPKAGGCGICNVGVQPSRRYVHHVEYDDLFDYDDRFDDDVRFDDDDLFGYTNNPFEDYYDDMGIGYDFDDYY
ncbi:phytanoyl-CoA hydroxylase-interacting protein-like [Haliotis rufescens]|uniref:phytanoyl-CoA hydroxylase-interacting protein-like n=1 Tax=Haliotis rufescens TaxID=6454 RepID=UPI00201EAECE|nr:phytanoyl-CoA hydroxylase-interacting protein-like [Haliotis rufescens]